MQTIVYYRNFMQIVDIKERNQMEYQFLLTVTESLDIFPIEGVLHQSVNLKTKVVIEMTRRRIKATGDMSVHIIIIQMILYYSTKNIIFQTDIIRLLVMIL